ncbi:MAG: glycogen debranching protein GlgX [Acidimicrobiia bacterium]|nr:glycogen debranching protein GlgX [Acidimicrobiia bacterium]
MTDPTGAPDPQPVWPGDPYPLGATFDGVGTRFSVVSSVAEGVELSLFADDGTEERVELPERSGDVWHGELPDVQPGQRYGFRVHGPWDPAAGLRCNPANLLLDPYAKAVEGEVRWDESVFSHTWADPDVRNDDDSAPFVPRSIVVNPFFDWDGDRLLRTPWSDTVIYEVHVKGATALHPDIPEDLRGTYGGLAHPAFIEHLTGLGISAVELLPVHQFLHDAHLVERGLRNYWGYNSIGFLAPHNDYANRGQRGEQVQEFRAMVRDLHSAGIEVILDVVYNHSAEGNHLGPTLSLKGFDNAAYYRLVAEDPRFYFDYTGTGNTLNMRNPHTLQLVMDSLRWWVTEMHVDGFRFDLASTLARSLHEVDRLSAFFDLVQQDPVISQVKLIAEPWDVGEGGYQVGNFPPLWAEWNGRYRDSVRDFWRGEDIGVGELAYRLTGSSDLYEDDARRPHASVNFVTAHDGFTLNDLVSYHEKHNDANGEGGNDGESHNRSWNCGAEGPTDDAEVLDLRARQRRNFLTTLLMSQGVPMLLHGDELGRTQSANNNVYCQDNETAWIDWTAIDAELLDFTARLVGLRRRHRTFRRRRFFQGKPIRVPGSEGPSLPDIAWFDTSGEEMTDEQWQEPHAKAITAFFNGDDVGVDRRGVHHTDDRFLLLLNGHDEELPFTVPPVRWGTCWIVAVDTAAGTVEAEDAPKHDAAATVAVAPRSVVLLRRAEPDDD